MTFLRPRVWFAGASGQCLAGLLLTALLWASPGTGEEKKKAGKLINLNTATVKELVRLPGVGKVTAERIVRHREKSGRFRSVEELLIIRGISRKKLEALRALVTVERETPPASEKRKKE